MATKTKDLPISKELLDILRCPQAVQEPKKYGDDPGRLRLVGNSWLVSDDSGLKYPIRDGIPVMLIEEGMKWKDTAESDLPIPPPDPSQAQTAGSSESSKAVATSDNTLLKVAAVLIPLLLLIMFFRNRD